MGNTSIDFGQLWDLWPVGKQKLRRRCQCRSLLFIIIPLSAFTLEPSEPIWACAILIIFLLASWILLTVCGWQYPSNHSKSRHADRVILQIKPNDNTVLWLQTLAYLFFFSFASLFLSMLVYTECLSFFFFYTAGCYFLQAPSCFLN